MTACDGLAHLSESARAVVDRPGAERTQIIREGCWVSYTRATEVLARLEDLFSHPVADRMPNALLVADSNNGKTAILKRFVARHAARPNVGGDAVEVPVVAVQTPPSPDEQRLYHAILDRLRCPYRTGEKIDRKQARVVDLLRTVSCRVLVLDEFHNALAGSLIRRGQFLNAIKYLGNELMIPLVVAGTRDAFHLLQQDEQFQNRFKPEQLPRWACDREWRRLLLTFEGLLPLRRPSGLAGNALAGHLHGMSEGVLGEVADVLRLAAAEAIASGEEHISIASLERLAWTAPAHRKWRDV